MNRIVDKWRESIEVAKDDLLALPRLHDCPPEESIRALTRSHLEKATRSNGALLALPLVYAVDRELASSITRDYRDLARATLPASTRFFIHSERIISGKHDVSPQLSFLAEISSPAPSNHEQGHNVVWHCHTTQGIASYRSGPAVTHLATSLRAERTVRRLSDFSPTPLLSPTAFREDLQRIIDNGARLAIGLGEPSYILSLAIAELDRLKPSKWGFQPSCVGSIQVEVTDSASAVISIATNSLGVFHLQATHSAMGECAVELA